MNDKEFLSCYLVLVKALISHGKKGKAEKVLLETFSILRSTWNVNPVNTVKRAVNNVCPAVRIQTRRRGSQRIRVPIPLNASQRLSSGARLICGVTRGAGNRGKSSISSRLATELLLASRKEGAAFSKMQLINKEGVDSQPNSHLRWF